MGIGIACQEQRLEEEHAGRPHSGRAAELWKNESRNHWLHREEECRREQERRAEKGCLGAIHRGEARRFASALKQATAQDGVSNREINDDPRDVHESRHERS